MLSVAAMRKLCQIILIQRKSKFYLYSITQIFRKKEGEINDFAFFFSLFEDKFFITFAE